MAPSSRSSRSSPGFIENNNYVGRPADVLVMKDGSLLVSDDYNGAVYRVSYGSERVVGR